MFRVTFNNAGGELDSRTVDTQEQAAQVAIEMLQAAGALYDGDHISVEEQD